MEKSIEKGIHVQDENPQASLYKNLWLEAEAALCSIKYELAQLKKKACKNRQHLPGDSSPPPEVSEKSTSVDEAAATDEEVDDAESSLMARFRVLKSRIDSSKCPIEVDPQKQPVQVVSGREIECSKAWPFITDQSGDRTAVCKLGITMIRSSVFCRDAWARNVLALLMLQRSGN